MSLEILSPLGRAALQRRGRFGVGGAANPIEYAYWPGDAYLSRAYTAASDSMAVFASWIVDDRASTGYPITVVDGRAGIRQNTNGSLRGDLSNPGAQVQFTTSAGLVSPGDRVSVLIQGAHDGISRPYMVYQINDGAPVLAHSRSLPDGQTFRTGTPLYIGDNIFSDPYSGTIFRAALWQEMTPFDTYSEVIWRNFVNEDGTLADRADSIALYGDPVDDPDMTPEGLNAGTNLGSGPDYTVTGTFASGIASAWFDLSETSYSESVSAGTKVADIETNGVPAPYYSLTDDADGKFEIVGTELRRTAVASAYDGEYTPITIRETQASGTQERTFAMFAGQDGESTLLGRVSLSPSRTTVFQGEHIYLSYEGVTDKEAAMLAFETDFDDATEEYTNVRSGHIGGTSAQIKYGPQILKTFEGTTGSRTVTGSIYEADSATAVWSDTTSITVLDPSTITNVHVAASDGDFTGTPSGTQYTDVATALAAAWTQVRAGNDAIVYITRGSEWWSADQDSSVTFYSPNGESVGSLLIRATGSGADPIIEFGEGEYWGVTGDNPEVSISVSDIDPRGLIDVYGLVDGGGQSTYDYRTSFVSVLGKGHVTLSRISGKGIMQASQDVSEASVCMFDCVPVEFAPYSYYFGVADKSGLDGGSYLKIGEPNISKDQFATENPGSWTGNNPFSINGPGRTANLQSFVISHGKFAGFQGWSDGNTASQLEATYPGMQLSYHQTAHRLASLQENSGGQLVLIGNEIEGELSLTNSVKNFGRFIFARNHIVGHAGAVNLFTAGHRGFWLVSNVFVFANVPSEQGGSKKFLNLPVYDGFQSGAEEGRHYRQRVIGNTFIDLRSEANLQSEDDGTVETLLGDLVLSFVESSNNIVWIPNRTETDPGLPGLTLVSSLETDVISEVNYPGLISPTPGNYNPVVIPSADTDYATPGTTGMSGAPVSGTPAWSGVDPAYDFGGITAGGTSRKAGAHYSVP